MLQTLTILVTTFLPDRQVQRVNYMRPATTAKSCPTCKNFSFLFLKAKNETNIVPAV